MPKPTPVPGRDDAVAEAAQKRRSMSGAAVESSPARKRRQFSPAEKLRIIKAADAALASGERGALEALLRKEGLYIGRRRVLRGRKPHRARHRGSDPSHRARPQCCDWHTKHSPVAHGSFVTQVPSLPGETSHVAPNLVHTALGAGSLFFSFSAGGQPRRSDTAASERNERAMGRR